MSSSDVTSTNVATASCRGFGTLGAALQPRTAHEPVPLVAVQERFLHRVLPNLGLSARMCASAMRVLGLFDTGLLTASLQAMVERHEALRTRIVTHDGSHWQQIDAPSAEHVTVIDLTASPQPHDMDSEVLRLAREFLAEKVDVSTGPLFAAKLLKVSDREHVLILAVDHLIADAISCDILNRETWTVYSQKVHASERRDPSATIQFADYAVWQRRTQQAWLREHATYWTERLRGAQYIQISPDSNVPNAEHPIGAMLHFPLGKQLSVELEGLARREGVRLPLVVLVLYVLVMSRWCFRQDLVIEFVMHGRHRAEFESMIGFFAYALHLRIEMEENDSLRILLQRAHLEFASASQHEDYGRLFHILPECSTNLSFNWLSPRGAAKSGSQLNLPSQLKVQPLPVRFAWPVKFATFFSNTPAGIGVTVHYRPDLLMRETIERFGRNMRHLAAAFVRDPDTRISCLKTE